MQTVNYACIFLVFLFLLDDSSYNLALDSGLSLALRFFFL